MSLSIVSGWPHPPLDVTKVTQFSQSVGSCSSVDKTQFLFLRAASSIPSFGHLLCFLLFSGPLGPDYVDWLTFEIFFFFFLHQSGSVPQCHDVLVEMNSWSWIHWISTETKNNHICRPTFIGFVWHAKYIAFARSCYAQNGSHTWICKEPSMKCKELNNHVCGMAGGSIAEVYWNCKRTTKILTSILGLTLAVGLQQCRICTSLSNSKA